MLYISKPKRLLLQKNLYLTSIHRHQLCTDFLHVFRGRLYSSRKRYLELIIK
jgi:hypothetical protein